MAPYILLMMIMITDIDIAPFTPKVLKKDMIFRCELMYCISFINVLYFIVTLITL